MPRLTDAQRNQAIGMLHNCSVSYVARFFNTSRKTINLLRKMSQTGTVKDRPHGGRPMATTPGDDRNIRLAHLRNRFRTVSETARTFRIQISRQTVMRRLRTDGLRCRRPARRPVLTVRHRQRRVHWARAHRRWTLRMWEDVIFSNESRFYLKMHDCVEI